MHGCMIYRLSNIDYKIGISLYKIIGKYLYKDQKISVREKIKIELSFLDLYQVYYISFKIKNQNKM